MSDTKLVYSSIQSKDELKKATKASKADPIPTGPTKLRLEKKGRGGKQVSILYNIPLSSADAKQLMRELQTQLACGASYKDGEILISGDHRNEIEKFFVSKGLKIVRAGG